METLTKLFESRLDAFLKRTGLRPSMFGLRAAGDPNLMRQLRHGFSLTPAPAEQILAHVDAYERAHLDPVSSQSSRLRDSLSVTCRSFSDSTWTA